MSERGFARLGLAALGLALAATPALAEPSVTPLALPFPVEQFRGPQTYFARTLPTSPLLGGAKPGDAGLVAVWGKDGAGAALVLEGGQVRALPWRARAGDGAPLQEAPRDAIPHARQQTAGPLTVYLAGPRTEYRHGVLGDAVEAGQVVVLERQTLGGVSAEPRPVPTRLAAVAAGPDAVFEDLEPRLADLDRDGVPEILVVRSTLARGAGLAVLAKRGEAEGGGWAIRAETPPVGQPNRWLNPAAVADFDGDGRTDVALVRTPHLDGVLQVWSWDGGTLVLKAEASGYANHALGSTALDLAAPLDIDGDGRPELAIPSLDRTALAFVSLRDGGLKEVRRVALPARVDRGVAVLGAGAAARVVVGLEDGRVVVVAP